ncbi:glycosyltransferase [Microbacterium sp. RU33B]|uniref:glycosyltransferase n=1 Tax=Microbacterium sp. RU33B TaxID=1907390 RepID=UPI000978AE33|nr:glycosyltransferase [Microbacterium sp. RU33B]
MTRSATAGVMLTFHPPAETEGNLVALLGEVDRVFVVDNSPDGSAREVLSRFGDDPRVTFLTQDGNVGVAAGFNAGMRRALTEGYDFVWIFDQDSTVTPGMLEVLLSVHGAAGPRAGIVGPALRAEETGFMYNAERGSGWAPREVLISSGALFPRGMLEEIGLHDESLFIDYVDHDISLRARRAGWVNLKAFDTVLDHRFGASQEARLFGRRVYLSNYSPMRQYYMSRNRLLLLRRFGPGPWFREDVAYNLKAWIKVLLCERDRPQKIAAAMRGTRDGISNKAS